MYNSVYKGLWRADIPSDYIREENKDLYKGPENTDLILVKQTLLTSDSGLRRI